MSTPTIPRTAEIGAEHRLHSRLRVKPKNSVAGFVDGGWWPRSSALAAEVADLASALVVRLGPVETVTYHLGDWEPAPRKIAIDGVLVRLAGYHTQRPHSVEIIGARQRLTLLVVPPESTPEAAHAVLAAAGDRDDAEGIDALLALMNTSPRPEPAVCQPGNRGHIDLSASSKGRSS
jgi:hypothetical protein